MKKQKSDLESRVDRLERYVIELVEKMDNLLDDVIVFIQKITTKPTYKKNEIAKVVKELMGVPSPVATKYVSYLAKFPGKWFTTSQIAKGVFGELKERQLRKNKLTSIGSTLQNPKLDSIVKSSWGKPFSKDRWVFSLNERTFKKLLEDLTHEKSKDFW